MPQGEYCLFDVSPRGTWSPLFTAYKRNKILVTWGHLAAQCLGRRDPHYAVGAMYLEFENNGGAAATPPAFTDDDGIEYYNGLASSSTRDYVRVPIDATPAIDVAPGYEDVLPSDLGNRVIYSAITGASQGVHGKSFSAASSSMIFGVALAATPTPGDPTADILLARDYFDAGDQVPRTARQFGMLYRITFPRVVEP